jgi:hypothetical protein
MFGHSPVILDFADYSQEVMNMMVHKNDVATRATNRANGKVIFKRLGLVIVITLFITGCNLFVCGCGVPPAHIDLGGIQTVSVGKVVTVEAKQIISVREGNRALDLTGACLVWTFESKPTASEAQLEQSCKNLNATFGADVAGDYQVLAKLIYDDGHQGWRGSVLVTAQSLSSASHSER